MYDLLKAVKISPEHLLRGYFTDYGCELYFCLVC